MVDFGRNKNRAEGEYDTRATCMRTAWTGIREFNCENISIRISAIYIPVYLHLNEDILILSGNCRVTEDFSSNAGSVV